MNFKNNKFKIYIILSLWIQFLTLLSLSFAQNDEKQDKNKLGLNSLPTLQLETYQKYPLDGIDVDSAKIEPQDLAQIKINQGSALIIPQKAGTGTLHIVSNGETLDLNLSVTDSKPKTNFHYQSQNNTFENFFKKMQGIHVLQQNNAIILKGEFLSRKDYIETLSLVKFYQDKISLQARCAPGLKQTLILQAESILKKNGFNNLTIENANNRYFLEGVVTSSNELTKALSFVSDIIPNIENHVALPIQINPSLNFRVFILELSRAAHESLGLSWNNLSPQFINFSNKNNFSFNSNFTATLKHLSSNGSARVLSEPILSLRSGAEASVSAGGEIPLKITGQFDNRVLWKHYGLIIKIKVEGIAGNKIKTVLSSESSELDEGTSVDGVPGIKKSELKTALDMEEGEVVLLTGVFRSTASKEIERFPLLGSIPILGELFKSRRFREHESELLIAVVPKFGTINPRLPLESLHGLNFDKKWRLLD